MAIDYPNSVDVQEVNDEIWFDIINRTITLKEGQSIQDVLVHNDANSRNFGFMIQRYFEAEDLSTKNIRIHYINSLNQSDFAEAHSIEIVGDNEDVLSFQWLIGAKVCLEVGNVSFAIEFWDDSGYALFTTPMKVSISESIDSFSTIPDPEENWYESLIAKIKNTEDDLQDYVDNKLANVDTTEIYSYSKENLGNKELGVGYMSNGVNYIKVLETNVDLDDIGDAYRLKCSIAIAIATYDNANGFVEWVNHPFNVYVDENAKIQIEGVYNIIEAGVKDNSTGDIHIFSELIEQFVDGTTFTNGDVSFTTSQYNAYKDTKYQIVRVFCEFNLYSSHQEAASTAWQEFKNYISNNVSHAFIYYKNVPTHIIVGG